MDDKDKVRLIRAVPYITIDETNKAKLSAVDALWEVYRPLCEQYTHHFCLQRQTDSFCEAFIETSLSARWQRGWRKAGFPTARTTTTSNWYDALPEEQRKKRNAPEWTEPKLPTLKNVCIQANVNVIRPFADDDSALDIEEAHHGHFDYWLKFSTLTKGKPTYLPVKLAKYHREALQNHQIKKMSRSTATKKASGG